MLRNEGTKLSADNLQEWNDLKDRRGMGEHIILHHQFHGITKVNAIQYKMIEIPSVWLELEGLPKVDSK